MSRRSLSLAAIAASLLAVFPSPASAFIGVEVGGGAMIPISGFLQSKDVELRNGVGYSARASLILGNWFLGYELGTIQNGDACLAGACVSGDNGTTKFHALSATYHLYMTSGAVQPYLLFGAGAIAGTLGNWQTQGQASNLFGGDFRAGLGLEWRMVGPFFLAVEGRYRFLVTNNPMADVQQQVLAAVLGGRQPTAGDLFKENLKTTHVVQAVAGFGVRF